MRKLYLSLLLCSLYSAFCVFGAAKTANAQDATPRKATISIEKPLQGTFFEVQSDVTIAGIATPDSDIVLSTPDDAEYALVRSDTDGRWSYTVPTVSEGTQTVQATVKVKVDALSEQTDIALVTFIVGTASPNNTAQLAQTGILSAIAIVAGSFVLAVLLITYIDYRKHKKPLVTADPHAKYTYWHHLHVVSLPLLKYRFSFNVDKRLPSRSDRVRRY